ncbi:MAG TPA: hypothetical protein VHF02_06270 [Luteimonas sp.]|nr:hypothetical protein [Luteimonas sp.]
MLFMLCRNRVADFKQWRATFDAHASAHRASGLHLVNLWQAVGDEKNVFFLFRLDSRERAQAFIGAPEAAEAGSNSGVVEGEYHFIESAEGYGA